ncbi:MAG TPA: acyl-CoA dehydrogenase family protein [Streptosporangiaceae bacterium]|nr:acyl-CoA dehydrogenase family protein [Streptosporangiaceae bacterium]
MSDDFRARARAWLAANAPRRVSGDDEAESEARGQAAVLAEQKAFQAKLYDAGFAGITWPTEYGGQSLTGAEQIIWSQESRDYDLPTGAFFIGISMPGNTLVELGTEEQKKRYLPKMLRGEEIWCQLFSEPGAGSDVASLQTSAVRDGDEWVLNGQKVWTSGAQYSDFGAILARTDPTKPKHNGISMFIVDMHAPGVTVRPLKVATGHSPFNEVFFDNVRIPADALIGAENKGWGAAVVMLRHERIAIGTMGSSRTNPLAYDALRDLAAGLGRTSDQGVRRELAELYARGKAMQLFALLLREEAQAGRLPGARGSVAKLAGSDLGRFAGNVAADVLGDQIAGFDSEELQAVTTSIVAAPGNAIAGGTSEIQRNIIGERVLGLAKDPGVDRATPFNQLRVGTQRQQ